MVNTRQYFLQGQGHPLVFQHGLGASQLQVSSLLKDLKDVSLLCTDVPGHGACDLSQGSPLSFDACMKEVIRVMDLNGVYRSVAGGLSMGAGIATRMALKYPQRVCGLILLRPAWLFTPCPDNLQLLLKVADHLDQGGDRESFHGLPILAQVRKELPAAAASIMGMFNREQQENTAAVLRAMVKDHPCYPEDPAKIRIPALVIGNEDDPLHPWSMAEKWHESLPDSQLIKVTSRYIDNEKHRQEVTAAIGAFMKQIKIN